MTIRTKALMKDGGAIKEVRLDVLATPNHRMINAYGKPLYTCVLFKTTRKNHTVSKASAGIIVEGVYFALMEVEQALNTKTRTGAITPHLTFVGWDLLRIHSLAIKEEWEHRKRLEAAQDSKNF